MARSTVAQRVQIGRETTPGTAVPANKTLGSLSLMLSPSTENTTFRPKGTKYNTIVAPNKEWAVGSLEGQPTYEEVVYPLSSVLTAATITELEPPDVGTGLGAYEWVFSPSSQGADAPVIFTVEQGNEQQAERSAHVLFTEFGLEFSRSEASVSGEAFAYRLEQGITITPGATPVSPDLTPILPGQVCIYASDDPATLGDEGTRQGTALSMNPSISGRYNPVWYLNCVLDSFGTFVEAPEPEYTVEYMTEANANGMAWLDTFRAGATRFVRLEAEGPLIPGSAVNNLLRMDFAVKVSEPGDLADEDGIYAIGPTMEVVHDPAWGRASQVTVRNSLAAL